MISRASASLRQATSIRSRSGCAFAVKYSWNSLNDPNVLDPVADVAGGIATAIAVMIVQKIEWFECPPPWLRTALDVSRDLAEVLQQVVDVGVLSSNRLPSIAALSLST